MNFHYYQGSVDEYAFSLNSLQFYEMVKNLKSTERCQHAALHAASHSVWPQPVCLSCVMLS